MQGASERIIKKYEGICEYTNLTITCKCPITNCPANLQGSTGQYKDHWSNCLHIAAGKKFFSLKELSNATGFPIKYIKKENTAGLDKIRKLSLLHQALEEITKPPHCNNCGYPGNCQGCQNIKKVNMIKKHHPFNLVDRWQIWTICKKFFHNPEYSLLLNNHLKDLNKILENDHELQ